MWMRPFAAVEPHAKAQASGYSHHLSVSVDSPPEFLGEAVLLTIDDVNESDDGLFERILEDADEHDEQAHPGPIRVLVPFAPTGKQRAASLTPTGFASLSETTIWFATY